MSPLFALGAIGVLLIIGLTLGFVVRLSDGRRTTSDTVHFAPEDAGGAELGGRATLVQFSTETCARCPQVRRLLTHYAAEHDDVRHIEIDLSHRPDLSARYKVLQTPTTFVVDGRGAVLSRFHGVPSRQNLAAAVAEISDRPQVSA